MKEWKKSVGSKFRVETLCSEQVRGSLELYQRAASNHECPNRYWKIYSGWDKKVISQLTELLAALMHSSYMPRFR